MTTSQGSRRWRLAATILAVLTAGAIAAGATAAGAAPTAEARTVGIQDPQDAPDPRVDLRTASASVSRDGRFVTLTATLEQPTSPTSTAWWRGFFEPRAGITWGINVDPDFGSWRYKAELRGDPVLGPYGYVLDEGEGRVTCRVTPTFDGAVYRMRVPVSCIGSPARMRFGSYVQLYDEEGTSILGADYAPDFGEISDWLVLR